MAVRGDMHDRMNALERRVEEQARELARLSLLAQRGEDRWTAIGSAVAAEDAEEGDPAIVKGEWGLVEIDNQFTDTASHKVRAKNKTSRDIEPDEVCVLLQVNGLWCVVQSFADSDDDCDTAMWSGFAGYDKTKDQFLKHSAVAAEADDPCPEWIDVNTTPCVPS